MNISYKVISHFKGSVEAFTSEKEGAVVREKIQVEFNLKSEGPRRVASGLAPSAAPSAAAAPSGLASSSAAPRSVAASREPLEWAPSSASPRSAAALSGLSEAEQLKDIEAAIERKDNGLATALRRSKEKSDGIKKAEMQQVYDRYRCLNDTTPISPFIQVKDKSETPVVKINKADLELLTCRSKYLSMLFDDTNGFENAKDSIILDFSSETIKRYMDLVYSNSINEKLSFEELVDLINCAFCLEDEACVKELLQALTGNFLIQDLDDYFNNNRLLVTPPIFNLSITYLKNLLSATIMGIESVPADCRTNEVYILAIREFWGDLKEGIPEKHLTPQLCEIAVNRNWKALQYIPGDFRTAALCEAAINQNGLAIKDVPEKHRTQKLCELAVKLCYSALELVPEQHKTQELYELAIKSHGFAIQFISEEKRSEKLCIMAVKENNNAIRFVPKLRRTPELYRLLIEYDTTSTTALELVPEIHQTPELCKYAANLRGNALKYLLKEYRTPEICENAVKKYGLAIKDVPEEHLTPDLCKIAVKNHFLALKHVPEKYQTTPLYKTLCDIAVNKAGSELNITIIIKILHKLYLHRHIKSFEAWFFITNNIYMILRTSLIIIVAQYKVSTET